MDGERLLPVVNPAVELRRKLLSGTREERIARLAEFYGKSPGNIAPIGLATKYADHPIANLAGDPTPILDLFRSGMSIAQIAEGLGAHGRNVYEVLLKYAPAEWAAISAAGSLERMERSDELLDGAENNVEVQKASAIGRNAQWMLERLAPKLYGVKQDSAGVNIVVNIDPTCGGSVLIDGQTGGEIPE